MEYTSLKAFENIESNTDFKQIAKNIRKRSYKFIGAGSGRNVFDLGNGYVVKVARNIRGIAQNAAESKIASANDNYLFAKVLHVSGRFKFLIMERAEKVKHISFIWNYFNVNNNKELYRLEEMQDISRKYHLLLKDFGSAINWGQIDGKPVIIDFGFTQQVRKRFY